MTKQTAWRLRNLHRLLVTRLQDEQRKPRPNSFTVAALKQRVRQIREALALAEAHA